MTELDIAVVIVTYKCAALTIESLRSVAAERSAAGFHIRALVVDNASGDAPSIAEAIESNGWRSWVTGGHIPPPPTSFVILSITASCGRETGDFLPYDLDQAHS